MNTYFNYQAPLRSIDLSRAISIPKGIGPFTGFGSGIISESGFSSGTNQTQKSYSITLYPDWYTDNKSPNVSPLKNNYSYLIPLIKDIRERHGISLNEQVELKLNVSRTEGNSNSPTTFGVITKDGFIAVNNLPSWTIPIMGYTSQNSPKEVVVFARHNYIEEAVDNPVTLEAYAIDYGIETKSLNAGRTSNYSDINSFYDLYRRSLDIYYNQDTDPDFVKDNPLSQENDLSLKLTYQDLLGYVSSKCDAYANNPSDLTLIGIYGNGSYITESGQSATEPFSIVPYNGVWPYELPFNTAVMNCLTKSLNRVQTQQEGFPFEMVGTGESLNIIQYINYQIEELEKRLSSSMDIIPTGLICLWDQETVPTGWHEYEQAKGRIVIGFDSNGIKAGPDNSVILDSLGSKYDTGWQLDLTSANLPKHLHALALASIALKDESNPDDNPAPADWSKYNANLVTNPENNQTIQIKWDKVGIKSGAIKTGPNLITTDTGTAVSSSNLQDSESASIQKILPSITLMYIQKD